MIVADDPVFGRIAYGGELRRFPGRSEVIPEDGVGRRLHILKGRHRIHLILGRDGFAEGEPLRFDDDLQEIAFTIENRDPRPNNAHNLDLAVSGLDGQYEVVVDGKRLMAPITGPGKASATVSIAGDRVIVALRRLTGDRGTPHRIRGAKSPAQATN